MSSKSTSPKREASVTSSLKSAFGFLGDFWSGLAGDNTATGEKRRNDGDQPRRAKRRRLAEEGDISKDVFIEDNYQALDYAYAISPANTDLPGVDKVMAWMEESRHVDPADLRPAKRRKSEATKTVTTNGAIKASYSLPDLAGRFVEHFEPPEEPIQTRPRSSTLRDETERMWEAYREEERKRNELERRQRDSQRISDLESELKRLRGELEEAKTMSQRSARLSGDTSTNDISFRSAPPAPPPAPPPPPLPDVNSARWRKATQNAMSAALLASQLPEANGPGGHPRHRTSMSVLPGMNDMQAFLSELKTVKLKRVIPKHEKGKGRADGGLKNVLETAFTRKFAHTRTPARPEATAASEWSTSTAAGHRVQPTETAVVPETLAMSIGTSAGVHVEEEQLEGRRAALSRSRLGLDPPTPVSAAPNPASTAQTTEVAQTVVEGEQEMAPFEAVPTPSPVKSISSQRSAGRTSIEPASHRQNQAARAADQRAAQAALEVFRQPDRPTEAIFVKDESTSEDEIGLLGHGQPPSAPLPSSALSQRRRSGELLPAPTSSRPVTPSRTRRGKAPLRSSASHKQPSASPRHSSSHISPSSQGSDKENHRRKRPRQSTPDSSPDPMSILVEEPVMSGYGQRARVEGEYVGYGLSPGKSPASAGGSSKR